MIKYKLLDIEIFETKTKELYPNPKTKKAKRNDFLKHYELASALKIN